MVRKVLVTGGTGTIGKALVRRFAKNHPVIFQYRNNDEVADQLEQQTGAKKWKVDFRSEDIIVPEGIAILINNAGINEGAELTINVRETIWRKTIEVNLTATWRVTRHCLQGWSRLGGGELSRFHPSMDIVLQPGTCRTR